ncbi:MAG: hypothetical protein C4293_09960 [Nitrospiraceae bacterium]
MAGIEHGIEKEGDKIREMIGVKMGEQDVTNLMPIDAGFHEIELAYADRSPAGKPGRSEPNSLPPPVLDGRWCRSPEWSVAWNWFVSSYVLKRSL